MTTDCQEHRHCIEMFGKLSEYLDSELDDMTCEDIKRHAAECISCRVCMETLKRTVALCNNIEASPVPEEFSRRLKDAIAHMAPPR